MARVKKIPKQSGRRPRSIRPARVYKPKAKKARSGEKKQHVIVNVNSSGGTSSSSSGGGYYQPQQGTAFDYSQARENNIIAAVEALERKIDNARRNVFDEKPGFVPQPVVELFPPSTEPPEIPNHIAAGIQPLPHHLMRDLETKLLTRKKPHPGHLPPTDVPIHAKVPKIFVKPTPANIIEKSAFDYNDEPPNLSDLAKAASIPIPDDDELVPHDMVVYKDPPENRLVLHRNEKRKKEEVPQYYIKKDLFKKNRGRNYELEQKIAEKIIDKSRKKTNRVKENHEIEQRLILKSDGDLSRSILAKRPANKKRLHKSEAPGKKTRVDDNAAIFPVFDDEDDDL